MDPEHVETPDADMLAVRYNAFPEDARAAARWFAVTDAEGETEERAWRIVEGLE